MVVIERHCGRVLIGLTLMIVLVAIAALIAILLYVALLAFPYSLSVVAIIIVAWMIGTALEADEGFI